MKYLAFKGVTSDLQSVFAGGNLLQQYKIGETHTCLHPTLPFFLPDSDTYLLDSRGLEVGAPYQEVLLIETDDTAIVPRSQTPWIAHYDMWLSLLALVERIQLCQSVYRCTRQLTVLGNVTRIVQDFGLRRAMEACERKYKLSRLP